MREKNKVTFDSSTTHFYIWDEIKDPRGVVQIIHGMSEHAERYSKFAEFLNSHGFIVVADDHRAHGKTAEGEDQIGKYTTGQVFFDTLEDIVTCSKYAKQKYPHLPLILFGHSYGSYLLQKYMQDYHGFDIAILSGSCYMKNSNTRLGRNIAKLTMKFKGPDAPARLIYNMGFKAYDRKLGGSWLSTNEEETNKYYADPFCNKMFSCKFWYDMFSACKTIYLPESLKKFPKDKPVLIISGKDDMTNNRAKGALRLYKMFIEQDLNDVTIKIFPGARHELLFESEKIREEAKDVIISFINDRVEKIKTKNGS
jgi:alpha-beta hydrolase superfamily lysophospholipase